MFQNLYRDFFYSFQDRTGIQYDSETDRHIGFANKYHSISMIICMSIYIFTQHIYIYIYVIIYVDIYMCSHDIHIVHTIQKLIILLFPPRIPVILPIADHCCVRNRSVGAWSSRYSRDIMYISMRYPLVNRHSYGKSPSLSSVN